jgi:selenide,water dikinase
MAALLGACETPHYRAAMAAEADAVTRDLVLVGGGHTHVQVLRRWMMEPLPGVRLSVVLDRPVALYSGMVPGFVAGDYASHELEIDVVPLARRARARVILSAATRIDPVARRIEIEGRPPIRYDVASLDVGSTIRALDLPGVREYAVPTRPIVDFVDRIDERLSREAAGPGEPTLRVVVVGAGAAGLEIAFTLGARLRAAGREAHFSVLGASTDLLPGHADRVARRAGRSAEHRGIEIRLGVRVTRVERDALVLGEERQRFDLLIWATGAAPQAFLASSPLPLDDAGFVRVRPTLQVVGHADLFAAGDCASLEDSPWVRKAGVFAVREGPVLDANLRARLCDDPLRRYKPQRDFLMLLNLGGGEALGAKWGLALEGRWVWRLKDRIDRRFMRRFQVLAGDAAPAPAFPSLESMQMEEMPCGGCAAKLAGPALEAALARLPPSPPDASVRVGLDEPDDAAAVELPRGDAVLASIDGFRAFTDDPWLVGRVAAVNAVSDLFAKGGRPRHALALVTVPEAENDRAQETLFQVLSGIRATLDPLGISLVGGHTTSGQELFVGLSISGELEADAAMLRKGGLRAGQRLLLTRPLGTGVLLAADMQGLAPGRCVAATHAAMLRSNADAARVARTCDASACTDVSGFGVAGHLAEMLRASGVSARVHLDALPALPGALALLSRGVRSTYHEQNALLRRSLAVDDEVAGEPALELLFDPQTSGGLLFGVEPGRVCEALEALRLAGDVGAREIGFVTALRSDGATFEVVPRGGGAKTSSESPVLAPLVGPRARL